MAEKVTKNAILNPNTRRNWRAKNIVFIFDTFGNNLENKNNLRKCLKWFDSNYHLLLWVRTSSATHDGLCIKARGYGFCVIFTEL